MEDQRIGKNTEWNNLPQQALKPLKMQVGTFLHNQAIVKAFNTKPHLKFFIQTKVFIVCSDVKTA